MGWGCSMCGGINLPAMRFCGYCGRPRSGDQSSAAVAAREEVRLVTALFADISGFTSLADRLDVEDLHAVISPVIAALATIAERHEGWVVKYAGDALLVF